MRRRLTSATAADVNRLLAVLWMALLALAAPAAAQNFPEHRGSPVVDDAGLLRPEQVIDLKSKAEALHAQTGRALVVATVKSLDGLTVEDYGGRLLRHWKVGDEKRDDGVILLVAPKEKKVRIETGYGAEGFLPDILAGRIIRDVIVPKFKEGDMAGGVVAGADAIVRQMSLSPEEARATVTQAEQRQRSTASKGIGIAPIMIGMMIIFMILRGFSRRTGGRRYQSRRRGAGIDPWIVLWGLNELSRSRGRGSWGGGGWSGGFGGGGFGGGGDFGGFGGGSGGGGGASGSW